MKLICSLILLVWLTSPVLAQDGAHFAGPISTADNLSASVIVITNGYRLTTNGIPASLVAGRSYFTNISAAITFTAIASVPSTTTWSTEVWWKNASGSDRVVTFPAGVVGESNSFPATVTATNNTQGIFTLRGYGQVATNLYTAYNW